MRINFFQLLKTINYINDDYYSLHDRSKIYLMRPGDDVYAVGFPLGQDNLKFTKGLKGEEFCVSLQLKTIADIGIIGLPNAGKSSLLASITSANPKIANYKFTTINPNLGVAVYDDKEITLADIPGLIEGAHEGVGLGIKFLKHIERCKSLLHMIDITEEDLNKSYNQVRKELKNYSKDLVKKDEIVVLNKIDLLEDKQVKKIKDDFLKKYKGELITLSTLDKKSISNIKSKILKYVS